MVSGELADARRQVGDTLFGYIYIGLPMAYIVYAKSAELWGKNFLLIVGVTVALCDVIGFAAGSVVKGPRLLPALNPGKTWPSAAGNLVGAVIGVAVLWVLIPEDWTVAGVVVLVVMLALGSVWGDLTEYFVRHAFQVRTTSPLIAGFGGVLDRVDSLLMALPFAYYALLLTNNLTR
jgi:phosphatidate cytidylyltransferase